MKLGSNASKLVMKWALEVLLLTGKEVCDLVLWP